MSFDKKNIDIKLKVDLNTIRATDAKSARDFIDVFTGVYATHYPQIRKRERNVPKCRETRTVQQRGISTKGETVEATNVTSGINCAQSMVTAKKTVVQDGEKIGLAERKNAAESQMSAAMKISFPQCGLKLLNANKIAAMCPEMKKDYPQLPHKMLENLPSF